jgi:hypothetical protein
MVKVAIGAKKITASYFVQAVGLLITQPNGCLSRHGAVGIFVFNRFGLARPIHDVPTEHVFLSDVVLAKRTF